MGSLFKRYKLIPYSEMTNASVDAAREKMLHVLNDSQLRENEKLGLYEDLRSRVGKFQEQMGDPRKTTQAADVGALKTLLEQILARLSTGPTQAHSSASVPKLNSSERSVMATQNPSQESLVSTEADIEEDDWRRMFTAFEKTDPKTDTTSDESRSVVGFVAPPKSSAKAPPRSPIATRTRTGTPIKRPQKGTGRARAGHFRVRLWRRT